MDVRFIYLIDDFVKEHPPAKKPLLRWQNIMTVSHFAHFSELRKVFNSVDKVGAYTIFNIGGNKYRLATLILYAIQVIEITSVMTHEEYNEMDFK